MAGGPLRVVHYVNQFFAGIGGEEKAGHPLEVRTGAVGPGLGLEAALGASGSVVATLVCGDNVFHEQAEAVREGVRQHLIELRPDLLVAGPAFNAGRYGAACGAVCDVAASLSVPALAGLHPENPAVELFRRRILIVPVGESALSMREALPRLASAGLRLARAGRPRFPEEEGFLRQGLRRNAPSAASAAERAVAMLIAKLERRPYATEIPLPKVRTAKPAPPVGDLSRAVVALISTGGIVPAGNPDGLKHINEPRWKPYSVRGQDALSRDGWEPIHGGYDASWARDNPNLVVPLDALRVLESRGAIGGIHGDYYAAVGVGASVSIAERVGAEMAEALVRDGVSAAILTAT